MAHSITFDTLAFVKKLEAAGFNSKQSEALTEAVADAFEDTADRVATHQDLVQFKSDFSNDLTKLRAEFKHDMAELKAELKSDMAELKAELKGDMAELKAELKADLIKWMVSLLFAQTAILLTILTLLKFTA